MDARVEVLRRAPPCEFQGDSCIEKGKAMRGAEFARCEQQRAFEGNVFMQSPTESRDDTIDPGKCEQTSSSFGISVDMSKKCGIGLPRGRCKVYVSYGKCSVSLKTPLRDGDIYIQSR